MASVEVNVVIIVRIISCFLYSYLVKVAAQNRINSVVSVPKELTLIEPVRTMRLRGRSAVKVNEANWYVASF